MLEDLCNGVTVSDDELAYVMKVADTNGDKAINPIEMSTLLNCWANYQNSRVEIERHFRKHDPHGTDRLDRFQLRKLLEEIAGNEVEEEELDWILKQADILKNGVITKMELRRVLALWDTRLKADKQCCTVL